MIQISEDLHVHSTFSDGQDTIETNIQAALDRGLERLTCVDHVRRDTDWLPEYAAEVRRLQAKYDGRIELKAGIEAKMLDTHGTLDVPADISMIDVVYVADHQFPFADAYLSPKEVTQMLTEGWATPERMIRALVKATIQAMLTATKPQVIAHLFSILPKVGLRETQVPTTLLYALAETAARTGTPIEISERWRCPSSRAARVFAAFGVPLVFSTDAHRAEDIGQYEYVRNVHAQLQAARLQVFA